MINYPRKQQESHKMWLSLTLPWVVSVAGR